jgi:hypothetical protein
MAQCQVAFSCEFPQIRIALATGGRIIAINLPVVGEAVCRMETQMRNTLTNMKQDGLQNRPSFVSQAETSRQTRCS